MLVVYSVVEKNRLMLVVFRTLERSVGCLSGLIETKKIDGGTETSCLL